MEWFSKFFLRMDKDPGAGGGGGSNPPPEPTLADLKASNDALMKKIEALEAAGKKPPTEPEADLADKARKEREEAEKKSASTKVLESALKFNLGAADFLKTNASLLPKTIEGIFSQAEKENYADAIEKSNSIKVGVVSEFFALKENVELLTAAQKVALEDFNKLTKNAKAERVQGFYDSIFEPTLETLRKVKKAEALQKGLANPSDTQDAYKQKMINFSKKHYLGEKNA